MEKLFIIVVSYLLLFSPPAFATLYKCTNEDGKIEYKDKPCSGGNQEQIQQKSTGGASPSGEPGAGEISNYQEKSMAFLDNLKQCKPINLSYEMPFFGKIKNQIVGKNNGRCHVITYSDIGGEVICNYSDETIAMLTSEEKYQEIRSGEFSGSSDSPEAARMTAECIVEDF